SGGKAKSCKLKWREKTNIPPDVPRGFTPPKPNQWYDVMDFPFADQTHDWATRKEPCGGSETVSIWDQPAVGRGLKGTPRRLEFEFTLESAPGCQCSSSSITKRAYQVITLINGQEDPTQTFFEVIN